MGNHLDVAYDRLGQEIKVGSVIVAPYTRARTVVAQITSISPKKVRFEDILRNCGKSNEAHPVYSKYHNEVVCIDSINGLGEILVMAKLTESAT